jgi:SAM-dependent methyltransferase
MDGSQVYAGPEFDRWAHAQGLIAPECFLIERYLNRFAATLEAGTGAGRILHAMAQKGFERLEGFDIVPSLITEARRRHAAENIEFDIQDARTLSYPDASFDQLIYLQQVICFITDAEGRRRAIAEAYRILRPRGIAVFSFLLYETRLQSLWHRGMLAYLAALRALLGRREPLQSMPWLSHRGRFNVAALLDRAPYVYWFRRDEAVSLLASEGFTVVAVGTLAQIQRGKLCPSVLELEKAPTAGMLYVVCRK